MSGLHRQCRINSPSTDPSFNYVREDFFFFLPEKVIFTVSKDEDKDVFGKAIIQSTTK